MAITVGELVLQLQQLDASLEVRMEYETVTCCDAYTSRQDVDGAEESTEAGLDPSASRSRPRWVTRPVVIIK